MAIIQVRDVPDRVAQVVAEKAAQRHISVSAYLRALIAADAEAELRRRAMNDWIAEVEDMNRDLAWPNDAMQPGADLVRELRDDYHRTGEL